MDPFKAAVEGLLDAVVSDDQRVTARGEGFTVRPADGHAAGPDQEVTLHALRQLWTTDPTRAFQVVGDYDKARTRVRNARAQLASGSVRVRCDGNGIVASGYDELSPSLEVSRLLAQLHAGYRHRPQMVQRLIGAGHFTT